MAWGYHLRKILVARFVPSLIGNMDTHGCVAPSRKIHYRMGHRLEDGVVDRNGVLREQGGPRVPLLSGELAKEISAKEWLHNNRCRWSKRPRKNWNYIDVNCAMSHANITPL